MDTVAEKVCQSCGMAHYCWDEEVYRTYSMTFSALSCCDGAGRVTTEQLPAWFQEMCPRKEAFAQTVCTVYERYRQDLVWAGRLQECRNLVGQQLDAVGGILEELTGQMDTGCIILENLQESLTLALRKAGIRVREVQVTEEKGGRGKQVRLVYGDATAEAFAGKPSCRWCARRWDGKWNRWMKMCAIWKGKAVC